MIKQNKSLQTLPGFNQQSADTTARQRGCPTYEIQIAQIEKANMKEPY